MNKYLRVLLFLIAPAIIVGLIYFIEGLFVPSGYDEDSVPTTSSYTGREEYPQRSGERKPSDKFPNILLRTHNNEPVRFYDDLVKDRIIIVNFMYTRCEGICSPTVINLKNIHRRLGKSVGKNVLILSISIDADYDTPEKLKEYVNKLGGELPGWLYLTGDYDEIEVLRRRFGVYDLDPVIDADKSQHSGIITFGNDRNNQWAALPALMDSEEIVETIYRVTSRKRLGISNLNSR